MPLGGTFTVKNVVERQQLSLWARLERRGDRRRIGAAEMPFRAAWRGFLHTFGLAELLELREAEAAGKRAVDVGERFADLAQVLAKRNAEMAELRETGCLMQRQDRAEPCRDGDPHDF
jgi:hypothetical protein